MDYMNQILSADCSGTMFNVCERLVPAFFCQHKSLSLIKDTLKRFLRPIIIWLNP